MADNSPDIIQPRILGARLREAREARGWTQQQLAERLKLARTTVVAIEKGERRLKPAEIIEITSVLGLDISEVLQRGAPIEELSAQLRGSLPPSPLADELLPYVGEFQHLCEDYARLEELCQAPLRRRFPPEYDIQGVDPELAAEDVAAAERRRLDLGEGPLVKLREILEGDIGIRVFQLELPSEVAGMFVFAEPLGACIAVNLRHSVEKRRESLAHELGHFLTDRHRAEITVEGRFDRVPARERFAQSFARAFLMPAAGLRRRFLGIERDRHRGLTYSELYRLALFYAVSLEAMTRRLEELRLIPSGSWERLQRERLSASEAQQPRRVGPVGTDDDILPSRYIALAIEAWESAELSEGQLARLLRTDRLGARERIDRLAESLTRGTDQGEPLGFGEPLFGSTRR